MSVIITKGYSPRCRRASDICQSVRLALSPGNAARLIAEDGSSNAEQPLSFFKAVNSWMHGVTQLAGTLWPQWHPLSEGHPLREAERDLISGTFDMIEKSREFRDAAYVKAFVLVYSHAHRKRGTI